MRVSPAAATARTHMSSSTLYDFEQAFSVWKEAVVSEDILTRRDAWLSICDRPSHTKLDGGTYYVPWSRQGDFNKALARAYANRETYYLAELKPPTVFPLYCDLDAKFEDGGEVDRAKLWTEQHVLAVTQFLCRCVNEYFEVLPEQVVMGPLLEAADTQTQLGAHCIVLRTGPINPETTAKIGVHMIWQHVVVDSRTASGWRMYVLRQLEKRRATDTFPAPEPWNGWEDVIDQSVYRNGLRMVGAFKAKACPNQPAGQKICYQGCKHCGGRGKIPIHQRYTPHTLLHPFSGEVASDQGLFEDDPFWVVKQTSIRRLPFQTLDATPIRRTTRSGKPLPSSPLQGTDTIEGRLRAGVSKVSRFHQRNLLASSTGSRFKSARRDANEHLAPLRKWVQDLIKDQYHPSDSNKVVDVNVEWSKHDPDDVVSIIFKTACRICPYRRGCSTAKRQSDPNCMAPNHIGTGIEGQCTHRHNTIYFRYDEASSSLRLACYRKMCQHNAALGEALYTFDQYKAKYNSKTGAPQWCYKVVHESVKSLFNKFVEREVALKRGVGVTASPQPVTPEPHDDGNVIVYDADDPLPFVPTPPATTPPSQPLPTQPLLLTQPNHPLMRLQASSRGPVDVVEQVTRVRANATAPRDEDVQGVPPRIAPHHKTKRLRGEDLNRSNGRKHAFCGGPSVSKRMRRTREEMDVSLALEHRSLVDFRDRTKRQRGANFSNQMVDTVEEHRSAWNGVDRGFSLAVEEGGEEAPVIDARPVDHHVHHAAAVQLRRLPAAACSIHLQPDAD